MGVFLTLSLGLACVAPVQEPASLVLHVGKLLTMNDADDVISTAMLVI